MPPLFEGVDGLTDGLTSGFTDGFTDGFTEGFTDGLTAGRTDGLTAGLIAGLAEGRAKAIPLEVKSIMPDNSEQSIFFILTTPFLSASYNPLPNELLLLHRL